MAVLIHKEKEKLLSERSVLAYRCAQCQKTNTTILYAILKYVTFYWIPFAPDKIYVIAQCSNCDAVYAYNNMPPRLQQDADEFKRENKFPLWCFSGLGIILVFIGSLVTFFYFQGQETKKFVQDPRPGDRYIMSYNQTWPDDGYTINLHLVAIVGDTAIFFRGQRRSKGKYDVDSKEPWPLPLTPKFSTKELIKMEEKGEISEIDRDQ